MDTLFSNIERYKRNLNAPLAVRMRPQTLDGYVGQEAAVVTVCLGFGVVWFPLYTIVGGALPAGAEMTPFFAPAWM